jgi:hypothetical protein
MHSEEWSCCSSSRPNETDTVEMGTVSAVGRKITVRQHLSDKTIRHKRKRLGRFRSPSPPSQLGPLQSTVVSRTLATSPHCFTNHTDGYQCFERLSFISGQKCSHTDMRQCQRVPLGPSTSPLPNYCIAQVICRLARISLNSAL